MMEKTIFFDKFEFPVIKGLDYLKDENKPTTDYLFINERNDGFSMYFEKDFPKFTVPKEKTDREYLLLEFTKPNRKITFFCPEKHKNLDTVVWYFYMELFDDNGGVHTLPGQVRVIADEPHLWQGENKPQFLKILEQVKLKENYA